MHFEINLEISEFKKENTSQIMYRNIFKNTLQKYHNYKHIYTDASETDHNIGITIVTENSTTSYKLPPKCSIYTAEAIAIYKAVQNNIINKETSHNKYLILSDSLSSLTGINNLTNPTDISKLIQDTIHVASQKGIEISFLWIPGHCGIDSNELADQEASKAVSSTDTQILNLTKCAPSCHTRFGTGCSEDLQVYPSFCIITSLGEAYTFFFREIVFVE
ncbi:hypothetical protein QTP88_006263 [Uroleucon formosanum]